MKLKSVLSPLGFGFICALFVASCTPKKVPTGYNAKGMTNAQARVLYIDNFKLTAIREMERTGIPASIKLAQGILESNSGRSDLSSKYNNHFGIKCHSDWQGERVYKEDDDRDPLTGQIIKSCFRAYRNADESFIAHSEFLRDPRKGKRYGFLFQLEPRDYAAWAEGLERAGYATAQDYSEKLVRIIEDNQLHQYDLMASKDVFTGGGSTPNFPDDRPNNPNRPNNPSSGNNNNPNNNNPNNNTSSLKEPREGTLNDARYVKVYGGLSLEQVAARYEVSMRRLQEYNEEIGDPVAPLADGTNIFLQQKRSTFRGSEDFHRVAECETMFDISQKFGIKLSKLYAKNEMREGDQPAVGQKIALRLGWFQRVDMPALRDTFNEWRKCKMPATPNKPSAPSMPPYTRPSSSSDPDFDISPNNPNTTGPQYGGTIRPPYSPNDNQNSNPNPPRADYPSSPTNGNTTYPSDNYPPREQPSTPSTPSYPSYPSRPTTTQPSNTNPNSYPSVDVSEPPYTPPPSRPTTQPSQPSRPNTQPARPNNGQFYTVLQGETLWAISRKFGTTVDQIKALNKLADNNIKPGQQLRVK